MCNGSAIKKIKCHSHAHKKNISFKLFQYGGQKLPENTFIKELLLVLSKTMREKRAAHFSVLVLNIKSEERM